MTGQPYSREGTHHLAEPIRGKSRDGIYPRCVWCNGENYALAVLAYSAGEIPCAAVNGCGRMLPADYITYQKDSDD